jgi:hypothetical protein
MIEKVLSKNDVPIRLTDERWTHIVEEHCELAGMRLEVLESVASPSRIETFEFLTFSEIACNKNSELQRSIVKNSNYSKVSNISGWRG